MFTGIIEEVGAVTKMELLPGNAARVVVRGPKVVSDAQPGSSIAVNGVCLTVTEFDDETFHADVMAETLAHTTFETFTDGTKVNLERAVRADSRLGGHVVSGHVDCVATLVGRTASEYWEVFRFELDPAHARFLALKGSVTVDGISLTVSGVGENESQGWFEVSLIPTTLTETTLGAADIGTRVNIETDILAKYVDRLMEGGARP